MQSGSRSLPVLLGILSMLAAITWLGFLGFVVVAFRARWGDIKLAEVVSLLLPPAFWMLTAWSCRAAVSRSGFWWSGLGAQAALVGLSIEAMSADPLSVVVFLCCLPLSLGWVLLAAERVLREGLWRPQVPAAPSLNRSPITDADDERP